jgi:hypothetical protein
MEWLNKPVASQVVLSSIELIIIIIITSSSSSSSSSVRRADNLTAICEPIV